MAMGPDDHVPCPSRPRCASAISICRKVRSSTLEPSRARSPAIPLIRSLEASHVHEPGARVIADGRAALSELGDAAVLHEPGGLVRLLGHPRCIQLLVLACGHVVTLRFRGWGRPELARGALPRLRAEA